MKIRLTMALALTAAACGGDDGQREADVGAGENPPQSVAAVTDRLEDDQIAALIGLINGVEIAASKAVDAKLVVPAARALAETLIADHTRLMQAMPSYQGPRFPPPQAWTMNAVFRTQANMLSTLPAGTPFDATFAAIQIADHAMAIDSLRRWHAVAEDPALRRAIAQAVPVMQEHLARAKAVYAGLDVGPSPGAPSGSPPPLTRPDTSRADTAPRPPARRTPPSPAPADTSPRPTPGPDTLRVPSRR